MALDRVLNTIRQSTIFTDQLVKLKKSGRAIFSGLVGSSPSAIVATLTSDYDNLLIVTASTDKAEALRAEIQLFSGQEVTIFPAPDTVPGEEIQPAKELVGERLAILQLWEAGSGGVVVAPIKAVMWKTSPAIQGLCLSVGQAISLEELLGKLNEFGYQRFDIVGERGELSVRGGIVDIFPLNLDQPVRLEFLGDQIESIRSFDAFTQRSIKRVPEVLILPLQESFEVSIFDHLPKDYLIVYHEPLELLKSASQQLEEQSYFPQSYAYLSFEEIQKNSQGFKTLELSSFLAPGEEAAFSQPDNYIGKTLEIPASAMVVSKHAASLRGEIEAELVQGSLRGGFVCGGLTLLSDHELFGEVAVLRKTKVAATEGVADELLADLKAGNYVVHETYGIGRYRGTETLEYEGVKQEYFVIEFAAGDRVYVPPTMAGLVEKYSGGADLTPRLSRLGTKLWLRTKNQVKKSLRDMTQELLTLYAAREKFAGFSFSVDDVWQQELAATFPFEETPDQKKAIIDTKQDMEAVRPMDRLVCGDVGYGKTEVAIRAAVKAAAASKQVAILVPTTILAEQHYNNFKTRLKSLPFVVEMLSRFRTKAEQSLVVKGLAAGGVDIVIGTHRLLSRDIKFRDLGLLIVDEEQRFGVSHKEKLKKLKQTVDVLTLTATPIPRTLYLSLAGARDMSVINTPPVDRSPIRTYVLPWNEAVIREAILREIDRGGQVYFVHNFVESIEGMAAKIRKLVPGAKIAIGHGQLPEKTLEKTMLAFLDHKYDVLVCTSIIESGLDITNVNTILIDQADRFGLSQLYQIRGRVGRSAARAYAYLFYHPQKVIAGQALERLKAIQEFTALGSGYKLSMRDLEIRGSGNLLGAQQSGHILEVGFDLYCELLEEAVKEIKGIKEVSARSVEIDVKYEAYIPKSYIADDRQRMAIYRRMNFLSSKEELNDLSHELVDRFGQPPEIIAKLFELLNLKVNALKKGVSSIKESDGEITVTWLAGKKVKIESRDKEKLKIIQQVLNQYSAG